ncbi:MAG: CpsD/CapB family tyrosine-protein kinase [Pseudomonadota bacterium]
MNTLIAQSSPAPKARATLTADEIDVVLPSHYRGETVLPTDNKRKINTQLVSLLAPASVDAERYRRLRHSVEKLKDKDKSLVIGITSPVSGDGKTLTSINLAGALAQNPNSRVLLIELDLRGPRINVKDYLGIKKKTSFGISDIVNDVSLEWEKACYFLPDYNLYLMPAGAPATSPYELLASVGMQRMIEQARARYDYVIIDTAPVVLLPDSQLIAEWVDGFLVVIAADVTPRKLLEEAFSLMEKDKVLGLVFNNYTPVSTKYNGYY